MLSVTSARPEEGKSTTAFALAQGFARAGMRVLLVDLDLRNPSQHKIIGADNRVGASNLLTGAVRLQGAVQPTDWPNLFLIPSGPLPPSPAELLIGPRLVAFTKEATEHFDIVILDGPPVMGLADVGCGDWILGHIYSVEPVTDYNLFHMPEDFDLVVVGSGAAGMTAAAHRRPSRALLRRGGEGSAFRRLHRSLGGRGLDPQQRGAARRGRPDSAEDARAYLHSIIGDVVPAERIDTYLERGPEALSFVFAHSPLRMRWVPQYSDYYPEAPGGRVGGRSIEPKPFNAKRLGADLDLLEPDYGKAPLNVAVTQADYRWLNLLLRHPRGPLRVLRVGLRWVFAMLTGKQLLVRGQAMAAGLRIGLREAKVPVLLDTALVDLVSENGSVTGVLVRHNGEEQILRARRGVILGSGGFEHNAEMRQKYQRAPIGTEWTVGAKANTGDGILAGAKLGAALELMDDAWWGPSIPLSGGPWFCLAERTLPGGIMVNQRAQRFMNEAAPYVEAVHRMYGGRIRPRRRSRGEHSRVDDHRPALPQPVPVRRARSAQAVPRPLVQGRRARQGRQRRRTRRADGGTPQALVETVTASTASPDRSRRGLRPRRKRLRPLLRRSAAEPTRASAAGAAAVLRRHDGAGRPRHQGRGAHRRARRGCCAKTARSSTACTRPETPARR